MDPVHASLSTRLQILRIIKRSDRTIHWISKIQDIL